MPGHSVAFAASGEFGEELVYVAEVARQHRPEEDAAVVRAVRTELAKIDADYAAGRLPPPPKPVGSVPEMTSKLTEIAFNCSAM